MSATDSETGPPGHQGVLKGKTAWIISDGKAGHEIQMLGVAEALGVKAEIKRITAPGGLYKFMAPRGPVPRAAQFGKTGSTFAPPWPAIAFATGRTTTPYIRALKKHAGLATFTVILLDPKVSAASADLFWVPEHDRRRGANVVTTATPPHRYAPQRLAQLRERVPDAVAALPRPRVAVLVGGPNGDYNYPAADVERFVALIAALAKSGAGLMITTSRRTPGGLLSAIGTATAGAPRILWDGTAAGENPYPQFLAHADAFLVTADSVNMVGEAAATGRPIHVFHPGGGSPKFNRFHAALEAQGITRPIRDAASVREIWAYAPVNSARTIADEIERRYVARQCMIPGLCGSGS